jgi:CheY-like chemotaxis protein
MADPRVLLVDDQRQVTRMLRSSLELSGRSYEVLDVGSAEEALREMEQGPIDLVVTDLRLPEMTGLELIARIRQNHPRLRAILVTGQPTRQVEAQARALGVVAFIPKPVSTTLFLNAVDRALSAESQGGQAAEITGEKARAAERLMTMRRELGAQAALLVTLDGRPLLRAGDEDAQDLDAAVGRVVPAMAAALAAGAQASPGQAVGFLYLEGDPLSLYLTNVGRDRVLAIGFAVRQEAWQMGAIFHYARRVVEELSEVLQAMVPVEPEAEPAPAPRQEARLAADEPPTTPRAIQEFWDDAASHAAGQAPGKEGALSYEEARKLGLIPGESSD